MAVMQIVNTRNQPTYNLWSNVRLCSTICENTNIFRINWGYVFEYFRTPWRRRFNWIIAAKRTQWENSCDITVKLEYPDVPAKTALIIMSVRNRFSLAKSMNSVVSSHTRTVVRECFKGDEVSQWKRPKFNPSPRQNPLIDLHKNWQAWLRPGRHPARKLL